MSQSPSEKKREATSGRTARRRFQFSLFSLVVLVSVMAVCVSSFVTGKRLRDTETTLENLRNEVGELTIGDSGLVHAISIPSYEGMTYRWRVHLPEGRKFYLKTAIGRIPENGLPTQESSQLDSRAFDPAKLGNEFILAVAVNRNHLGQWQLVWDDGNREVGTRIAEEGTSWLETTAGHTWRLAGKDETTAVEKGAPLFLIRLRKAKRVGRETTVDMKPTDGVLVWISEDP